MVAVDVATVVVSGAVRGCVEEDWQQQVGGLSKKGESGENTVGRVCIHSHTFYSSSSEVQCAVQRVRSVC